jgi:hypothetical protein
MLIIVVGVVAVAAGYHGRTGKKSWGTPLIIAGGGLVLLGSGVRMIYQVTGMGGRADNQRLAAELNDFRTNRYDAAGQFLGQYLAKSYSGETIVVLSDENDDPARVKDIIDGLTTGVDGKLTISSHEKLANDGTSPVIGADTFENAVTASTARVVVSMVPMPPGADSMAFWGMDDDKRPRFIFVFTAVTKLSKAIEAGAVTAAIINKPETATFDGASDGDVESLFNERCVLIDKGNIGGMVQKYPKLFDVIPVDPSRPKGLKTGYER